MSLEKKPLLHANHLKALRFIILYSSATLNHARSLAGSPLSLATHSARNTNLRSLREPITLPNIIVTALLFASNASHAGREATTLRPLHRLLTVEALSAGPLYASKQGHQR